MRATPSLGVALLLAVAAPVAHAGEPAGEPGPVYLVYAGPYSSSPSSAFGHLFLVLARDARDPPPLWEVVTFNAVTFDADPVRYLTVGIAGGFLGRFDRFAFHQKTREYELLDDRDLWLLELRLGPAQRAALEETLDRTRGRWYPYSFFQKNCAWYLEDALAEATGAVVRPAGIVSPAEVFMRVQASELAGPAFHRPSASRRIAFLAMRADRDVRRRLRRADWRAVAADQDWLASLTAAERALAQEVFALRSLQEGNVLPEGTRAGLARLRLLAADPRADGTEPVAISGPGLPVERPVLHGYPRLRLRYVQPRAPEAGRIHLGFRAAMHDETDRWEGQQPVSTMELLGLEISAPVERPEPRLERAVLFSQRSLTPSDWTRPRTSWALEVLARRGGILGGEPIHIEARAGLGKTFALPTGVHAYALLTLAGVGALGEGAGLAAGLEAGFVAVHTERIRSGATWRREHDLLEWSRSVERGWVWTRVDLSARWGLVFFAGTGPVSVAVDGYL